MQPRQLMKRLFRIRTTNVDIRVGSNPNNPNSNDVNDKSARRDRTHYNNVTPLTDETNEQQSVSHLSKQRQRIENLPIADEKKIKKPMKSIQF